MMSNEVSKLLLSVNEAAEALGVSPRTVWSISEPRGALRVTKIGTRRLYAPADLARYIESQAQVA